MKTQLLDYVQDMVWDMLTEEKLKQLKMEHICFEYMKDLRNLLRTVRNKELFFFINEKEPFVMKIMIMQDKTKKEMRLYLIIHSIKGDAYSEFPYSEINKKYRKEFETIHNFFQDIFKESKLQIQSRPETRLFFCTGYTLVIKNQIEEKWKELQNI